MVYLDGICFKTLIFSSIKKFSKLIFMPKSHETWFYVMYRGISIENFFEHQLQFSITCMMHSLSSLRCSEALRTRIEYTRVTACLFTQSELSHKEFLLFFLVGSQHDVELDLSSALSQCQSKANQIDSSQ